jgi:tRNA synthetases class I (C) catalytic domain
MVQSHLSALFVLTLCKNEAQVNVRVQGHSRNYVTFDILRRILEDYFGYDIRFVMNVTDVDDKIILRARRNYLLKRYEQSTSDANKVIIYFFSMSICCKWTLLLRCLLVENSMQGCTFP